MSSSASTVLRMELMAQTENNGTWGNKTNANLGIIESAITGVFAIVTTGGTTTLANVDYTNDDAKNRTLDVSGALVSDATIVIPNAKRTYRINNRTSGAFAVKVKTSTGASITITQSTICDVICDGANGVTFATAMTNPTTGAPATASGAAASAVSVTPSGNLSSTNAQAALTELQGDIDTINALLVSSYQPLANRLTDLSSVAATKGNLYLGNGTNIVALGVGADGYVHVSDAASATGTKWSPLTPVGTVQIFYQAAAPSGWTVSNVEDDHAIRIVTGTSGAGGTTGGSTAFTTVFGARTLAQNQLPNVAPTFTGNAVPDHTHNYGLTNVGSAAGGSGSAQIKAAGTYPDSSNGTTTAAGGHTPSGTISSINGGVVQQDLGMQVKHIKCIKAAKAAY